MIWNSIPLMTLIDILIIAVTVYAMWCSRLTGPSRRSATPQIGFRLITFGLLVIGFFYFADLLAMYVLPTATSVKEAMAFMETLHHNLSWVVVLFAMIAICTGFIELKRTQIELAEKNELLAAAVAQARQATAELEQKTKELAGAYAQIQHELEEAQSLQRAILPQNFPRRAEFKGHALMWPARQLAGDFYDVLELPDGRVGVLIADVSGKGVPAAFFMGISRTVLRSTACEGQSPGTCLALANEVLCRTNPMDLFVTVFYGILNPQDGTFVYANGGHNSPLLVRNCADAAIPFDGTGSFVLGALKGTPYPERSVQLEPGDAMLLYTDGVTEAQNAAGEEFTEDRLIRVAGESRGTDPGAMAEHVAEAVRAFSGGDALADDLTCLVLYYVGTAMKS